MTLPKVCDFYNMGQCGNLAFFVGPNRNFVSDYIKKRRRILCKFQFEITRNKIKKHRQKSFDKLIYFAQLGYERVYMKDMSKEVENSVNI